MADITTYNQFVDILEDIASRHYQINQFGIGDPWEIAANTLSYPTMWVNPMAAKMLRSKQSSGYASFEIDFNIKVFDLVFKGEENETDVLSDTMEILRDIVTEFSQHPFYVNSDFNIVNDIDFEPFTESTDDEVSGWEIDITMRTPNKKSFCGLPIADIPDNAFPRPSSDVILKDVSSITSIVAIDPILASTVTTSSSKTTTISLDDPLNYVASTGGNFTGEIDFDNDVNFNDNVSFQAVEGSAGASVTFDLSLGNIFIYDFPNATTIDYENAQIGTYQFILQNQTTSSAITFSASKWQKIDSQTIAMTATTGAKDMFSAIYDGSKMIIVQAENIVDI